MNGSCSNMSGSILANASEWCSDEYIAKTGPSGLAVYSSSGVRYSQVPQRFVAGCFLSAAGEPDDHRIVDYSHLNWL